MSDRPASRPKRPRAASRPPAEGAASPGVPAAHGPEIAGMLSDAAATRSGEDTRRRGWFWHWNSIVTQYSPLLGLKGVGLLNSYTVWTDRREESPHRGFAFPSQQSEADFYGEDRAELITINKLLVALDLIEIRKEMVLRVDEQGRRWKVPHNFYRVKDHGDGRNLSSRDVLRVAELADRDQTVYRYVRRVFSPKFSPIDRDNIWVTILAEVRETELWQRLAERTAREEQRASDRTRAGHAARKGGLGVPNDGDSATPADTRNDSRPGRTGRAAQTSVASANNGSAFGVAPANSGLDPDSSTVADEGNTGLATGVAPTNRTYDQSPLTTTTTTPKPENDDDSGRITPPLAAVDTPHAAGQRAVTGSEPVVTAGQGAGPGGAAPFDLPGETAAVRAFEDANGRRSTPAERQLLRGLAERFEPAAARCGVPGMTTGWGWTAAAVYEAVEAGSAFVAPRRAREILARWERDGLPGQEGASATSEARRSPAAGDGRQGGAPGYVLGDAPDIPLPHGIGSRRTWAFAVGGLAAAIAPDRLADLVNGSAIVGYHEGEVTLAVPTATQADRLLAEYGELVARKLGEAMRRPVRLAVVAPRGDAAATATPPTGPKPRAVPREPLAEPPDPVFLVAECGLPSPQVWAAVLAEVAAAGEVSRADIELWLRGSKLLGRGADGRLVVGAVNPVAQRRIATRFAGSLRAAASAVVGVPVGLELVIIADWLAAHGSAASPLAEPGVA